MTRIAALLCALFLALPALAESPCCATGDLGLVVERTTGSLLVDSRTD